MLLFFLSLFLFNICISKKVNFTNPVRLKILAGEPVYGGFVTIPSPKIIENLALSGKLDFIWIEAEHTDWGSKSNDMLVRTCENEGLVPITRVPQNGIEEIKKYVGSGTKGIIVPNVRTKADAQLAVDSILYHPDGKRHAGVERANRYLGLFSENYLKETNDNMLVVVMIEHIDAVNNIDEILNINRIDVFSMGPYDLALSMGKTSTQDPAVQAEVTKAENAIRNKGKVMGGACGTYNNSLTMISKGYKFFTIPGDMEFLQNGMKKWWE